MLTRNWVVPILFVGTVLASVRGFKVFYDGSFQKFQIPRNISRFNLPDFFAASNSGGIVNSDLSSIIGAFDIKPGVDLFVFSGKIGSDCSEFAECSQTTIGNVSNPTDRKESGVEIGRFGKPCCAGKRVSGSGNFYYMGDKYNFC